MEERILWLDMTYGYQDYPILISPAGAESYRANQTPEFSGPYKCSACRFHEQCTLFMDQRKRQDLAPLSGEKLSRAMPDEMKFDKVKGRHTGQWDLDEMFKIWTFPEMHAWGTKSAAFRITYYHDEQPSCKIPIGDDNCAASAATRDFIKYIGFEFSGVKPGDVGIILTLAKNLCNCFKEENFYLCNKKEAIVLLSDEQALRHWIMQEFRLQAEK